MRRRRLHVLYDVTLAVVILLTIFMLLPHNYPAVREFILGDMLHQPKSQ